jgi:hypothetical protein
MPALSPTKVSSDKLDTTPGRDIFSCDDRRAWGSHLSDETFVGDNAGIQCLLDLHACSEKWLTTLQLLQYATERFGRKIAFYIIPAMIDVPGEAICRMKPLLETMPAFRLISAIRSVFVCLLDLHACSEKWLTTLQLLQYATERFGRKIAFSDPILLQKIQ